MRTNRYLLSLLLLDAGLVGAQVPTLVKDLSFGCAECGAPLQFGGIQEVAITADGRILVADKDDPMLRFFDAAGKPLWTAGRKGAGPGEYSYVLRAAIAADGRIEIADMLARRVTLLGPDHAFVSSIQLPGFFTSAGTDGAGHLVVGAEAPGGTMRIFRSAGGAVTPVTLPDVAPPEGGRAFLGSSVALSPAGVLAFVPHNERYLIVRLDAGGKRLADISRDIERPRRTAEEEATLRKRVGAEMGQVRAASEAARAGGTSSGAAPNVPKDLLSYKPHLSVDGLRYDASGRLWARSLRGDDAHSIFDVFSPTGDFLGSVTLDGEVRLFAFAGKWMVSVGEDADGFPVVTRWVVR